MANEKTLVNPLALFRPAPEGDVVAAVTAVLGWTLLEPQTVSFNLSRETQRLQPTGGRHRGKVLGGGAGGTIAVGFIRTDGETLDPAAFFEPIEATITGRFQFACQPSKVAVPLATDANPQYAGSAVITSVDIWGAGGTAPAVIVVNAEVDSDYQVWRA